MEDDDMADLFDGPTKVPNKPSRFAPKGKFKPKTKAEPSQSLQPVSVELSSAPKKEDLGMKPDVKFEAVKMDIDVEPEVKEESDVPMETETETETMGTAIEEQEEVVREIDVYFTRSMERTAQLYVLQFPLRPVWRPYELDDRCNEVRVKPASAELEMDLTIDVNSKNYDSSADPRLLMDKQTLTQSWIPEPHKNYVHVVGVLRGNKLHLNPIHAIVQFRPSMKHLNSENSKKKSQEGAVKSEEPQESKPLGVSKQPSKVLELNKDVGEGWVTLKYHSARTGLAAGYQQQLLAQETTPTNFSMTPDDYLDSFCPAPSSDSSNCVLPPRRSILALPLKERFESWFLEGPSNHRFDALKYVAPDISEEEVLAVLQECARLVQGLWFPKSALVCGTDQGIEILARDYILLLFSKNVIIHESQIPRGLLSKAKDALNELARERPVFNDWKLREQPDTKFMKLHPSVVKNQEAEWEIIEKKINDLLSKRSGPSTKTSSKTNTTNNPTTLKASVKLAARTSNAATSITAMTEETREAVIKALQKLFKSVKVCRFQQIGPLLRDMAVSERNTGFAKHAVAAANVMDAYPDEFKAIIKEVAVDVHGICVPKSSPEHPQYDAFRKVIIDLFLAEGPNAKLRKAAIVEAAKMELQRDVSNTEYQKVISELCSSKGGLWILNSGDGNPKL